MLKKIVLVLKSWIAIYIAIGVSLQLLISLGIVFFKQIIDTASNNKFTFDDILPIIVLYGIVLGVVCILNYINEYPRTYLQTCIREKIRILSLQKISRIDYLEYQKIGTGEMVKIIENGVEAGQNIIFGFYIRIFSELLPTVLINLIFVSFFDINIMIIISIGYLLIFIITKLLLKYLYKVKEQLLAKQENMSKYSIRSFMELVVFRLNKRYNKEIEKINGIANDIVNMNCKMTMVHECFFAIFAFLIVIIKLVVITIGVKNIITGNTTIGIVVAMLSFIDRIYSPIAIFNVIYVQYKLNLITYKRFDEFYKKPEDKNLDNGILLDNFEGNIEINNLTFSYGHHVLYKNLSLSIKKGTSVAIVGGSGGGKSTIIKLILGLLKKNSSEILIDGIDIDSINLNSYYDHISYISQDAPVFDATIKENIVFDQDVNDEKIYEYLDMVLLKDKVLSLKDKLNTVIGERGIQLSGGERQRLAFARILIQDREMIILDEPVSAMDNITEQAVMKNLIHEKQGKTLIIIAHRLQSIQSVDDIVVVKDGHIINHGTFDYLMDKCLYFKELWNKDVIKNSK